MTANSSSYSSYWQVSMSQWSAYINVVVFHTPHRGQRDTRLCPYFIICTTLYSLLFPHLWGSSVLIPLLYSSSPSLSASAAAADVSLSPSRSSTDFSQNLRPTCAPRFLSTASHRSRIVRVVIYYTTVFCLF